MAVLALFIKTIDGISLFCYILNHLGEDTHYSIFALCCTYMFY